MTKHVFRSAAQADANGPKRAVLYLRVSTGRQAANDVSLPSQRDITTSPCMTNNWIVVDEYIEAATGADDRRPAFQQMMERACDPGRPFNTIVFYSFIPCRAWPLFDPVSGQTTLFRQSARCREQRRRSKMRCLLRSEAVDQPWRRRGKLYLPPGPSKSGRAGYTLSGVSIV